MSGLKDDIGFAERLDKETGLWLNEGLITAEQKKSILLRYSRLKEVGELAGPGRLVTTVSILGSILVGIGVVLFIAANWSEIPKWGKLSIIFVAMLSSYGVGYYLRYERETYPKVGAALILLGSLIFGAGIFLIAQIFHVNAHYPNGPLMWGLGVLPLAYLLRYRSLLVLSLLDLLLWMGLETSFRTTGIGLLNIRTFIVLYLMCGISLWSTGLLHRGIERLKNIAAPYVVLGMYLTFLGCFILTFKVHFGHPGAYGLSAFFAGITVLFTITVMLRLLIHSEDKWSLQEAVVLLALFLLAMYYALAVEVQPPDAEAMYMAPNRGITLVANLIFAALIMGTIVLGFMRRQTAYVNIGLLFFAVDVIARYFDFFWELLPRSVFFIAGGLMLLTGGIFLERKRRKVLASFGEANR